jgi:hypothetical protein
VRGRRDRGRQRLADCGPHGGNLFLLSDDDFLSEPLDLGVASVPEHRNCHIDRGLVVRNHHVHEIAILSPDGLISIPTSILVIAPTFSERNGAS